MVAGNRETTLRSLPTTTFVRKPWFKDSGPTLSFKSAEVTSRTPELALGESESRRGRRGASPGQPESAPEDGIGPRAVSGGPRQAGTRLRRGGKSPVEGRQERTDGCLRPPRLESGSRKLAPIRGRSSESLFRSGESQIRRKIDRAEWASTYMRAGSVFWVLIDNDRSWVPPVN